MEAHQGNGPLIQYIHERIQNHPHHAISFRDYMDLCLYHEELGYYSSNTLKIGKEGDFYTSSSVGTIMGEMLAGSIIDLFYKSCRGDGVLKIVEWGGGSGRLASHILQTVEKTAPELYNNMEYTVVEESAFHRKMQRDILRGHGSRVRFLTADQWFAQKQRTGLIIFSNELLDAFPVHRIRKMKGDVREIFVIWDEDLQQFNEKLGELSDPRLGDFLRTANIMLEEGQTIEINLAAADWVYDIGTWLEEGHLITIDYGDFEDELYSTHRFNGTLMCYHKHQAHDNPYVQVGEQDITSHVNFSACIRAGADAGFSGWLVQTQRDFLVSAGVLTLLQEHASTDPFSAVAKKNRAVRQLLLSDQMSELFKVLVQTKTPRKVTKASEE